MFSQASVSNSVHSGVGGVGYAHRLPCSSGLSCSPCYRADRPWHSSPRGPACGAGGSSSA